jgi:hypothetical protein
MIEIDYNTWFTNRELKEKPIHFVQATAHATLERVIWVHENLRGRFCIHRKEPPRLDSYFNIVEVISFEDPAEAMFFDLRWS